MFDSQQKQGTDGKNENGKKKTAIRLTEVRIAVLVLAAVIIIKLVSGGKSPMDTPNNEPSLFQIYDISIPEFDGKNYVIEVAGGEPFFKPDEIKEEYYAELSDLDEYGRAGVAIMCADEPHIQTGERSSISDLKPSGWHGGGFYERSHLLMWKLSGLNKIENLVTGTATFNEVNMQDYEKKVTRYLWNHEDNHVMYRVTPYYVDDELVCRGVLMEAYSVEDDGALEFCIFVYNAEPGALIDYKTGDYMENAENMTEERPEEQK